jgi:hypothetical protein
MRKTRRRSIIPVHLAAVITIGLASGGDGAGGGRARADDETAKERPSVTSKSLSKPAGDTAGHKHTNRLIHATSPYLLQHAHNPVDWWPWGPEALERARTEDQPIFLSIGYSACHWCHVMERESFENEEIAALMNQHFVCIKVDREERPDLDKIYMAATQSLTGSGGWPMSVWLTPDLEPFFAGTYFPPEGRQGRPGFKDVLEYLARLWREDRAKALSQGGAVTKAIRRLTSTEPGQGDVPYAVVVRAATDLARAFDRVKGGLPGGRSNKFPPSMAMDLMLRVYHHSLAGGGGSTGPNAKLLELVELTLEKMAHGGIYDHLGGGFARYSTDADWLVPHFEKMLYDQALISDIYLKAYQLTKKPLYARVAGETLDYVMADLQGPEGGFYCTRDADSEGREGKFYVWSRAEVLAVLGGQEAKLFGDYYDVTKDGNWEGHNILNVPRPMAIVAKLHGLALDDVERRLATARKKLFEARSKRVQPHLDDKVLASWNGLMIGSMARGYRILGQDKYRDAAVRAAEFVLREMVAEGRLLRTYRRGRAHTPGYLDDYAFMVEGLLNLYETTFEIRWLDQAAALNEQVLKHFRDDLNGGFFFTADDGEQLLVRAKDANDGAIPSGNSVQLMNLLRLAVLLDRKDLAAEADRLVGAFGEQLRQMPYRSERLLAALDFYHRRPREVAFVARKADVAKLEALINTAWQTYVPNAVFARLIPDAGDAAATARKVPLLVGKKPLDGGPAAYVCKDYTCQAPTNDPDKLRQQISR